VLVAVRCVLDEIVLSELKALGLTASGFIHGAALLAMALGAIHDWLDRRVLVHTPTVLARTHS
jgi:hypothetical protein